MAVSMMDFEPQLFEPINKNKHNYSIDRYFITHILWYSLFTLSFPAHVFIVSMFKPTGWNDPP